MSARRVSSRRGAFMAAAVAATLAALLGAGCSRCGGGGAGGDAGSAGAAGDGQDAGALAQRRGSMAATDLRSALIFIFPEFRGAHAVQGEATLVRQLAWKPEGSLVEALTPALQAKGFTVVQGADGQVKAEKKPFLFTAGADGSTVTMGLSLPISEDDVGKLLHSPAPIGTEHLGVMLPSPAGAKVTDEYFVMTLGYTAKPERANFMVRSLVEGFLSLGWKPTEPLVDWKPRQPDGGVGEIPSVLTVVLDHADTGGHVTVQRNAGKVDLRYQQPLTLR